MIHFNGFFYLFGGWTGSQDLNDFWRFDLENTKWELLSSDTSKDNGPSPRSCFRMVVDNLLGVIYFLGRYVDRRNRECKADFYSYSIEARKWSLISPNTELDGGPPLTYDHQICFDSKLKILFCFGGRVVRSTGDVPLEELRSRNIRVKKYSGLFKWSALANQWTFIRDGLPNTMSRAGHGMIINDDQSKLFVLGGTRSKTEMNDFVEFDILTGDVTTIHSGFGQGSPPLGVTNRAVFDQKSNEIRVVLSGGRGSRDLTSRNDSLSLWIYKFIRNEWQSVEINSEQFPEDRFAHSLCSYQGILSKIIYYVIITSFTSD